MSPEMLRNIKLPPGSPFTERARHMVLRFLTHHNRLDGAMAFFAIYWAVWTIVFPSFWGGWPVTANLAARTGGHPGLVSWTLLLAGVGSYVSRYKQKQDPDHAKVWHWLRTLSALMAFGNWALMASIFISLTPIFSPGAACYSALAITKLFSYINYVLRNDAEEMRRELA